MEHFEEGSTCDEVCNDARDLNTLTVPETQQKRSVLGIELKISAPS